MQFKSKNVKTSWGILKNAKAIRLKTKNEKTKECENQ